MTRAGELKAIQCPNCGAGVDVLGGGRVVVQVCPYCLTELDATGNYRALRRFTDMRRPETPFRLGMEGVINGVKHQIIGIMGQTERHAGLQWQWVDHLIYSETHGYSWLTVEDGHFIWTRRVRWDLPHGLFSTAYVESAEHRPGFRSEGRSWGYFETSTSQVTYLEGAFTWVPRIDDTTTAISYLADGEMVTVEATGTEREASLAVLLPRREMIESFGIPQDDIPAVYGRHALAPVSNGPDEGFILRVAAGFAAAALVLLIYFYSQGERLVAQTSFLVGSLPQSVSFDVTRPGRLLRIDLQADVDNAWAGIGAELEDPEGELLFEIDREVGFYDGYDGGEYWSEGSTTTTVRRIAPEAGSYKLTLTSEGGEVEPGFSGTLASTVSVSVMQGLAAWFWMAIAFLGFTALAAYGPIVRYLKMRSRLAQGDWTDDDDDDDE